MSGSYLVGLPKEFLEKTIGVYNFALYSFLLQPNWKLGGMTRAPKAMSGHEIILWIES
jgi:hypothetical protein